MSDEPKTRSSKWTWWLALLALLYPLGLAVVVGLLLMAFGLVRSR
jgi:hypothetical protein